jgi:3'(2'), 5'-bisphosphate nucleotidase
VQGCLFGGESFSPGRFGVIHRTCPTAKDRRWRKDPDLSKHFELSTADAAAMLDELTTIVARAAALIRALSPATVARRDKADLSPVTAADEASEAAILAGLAKLLPELPVISEESAAAKVPPKPRGSFAIVDPLDGTKEFLAGSDEFAVLLALVTDGVPIAGIIAAPRRGQLWRGIVGRGAERLRLLNDGADRPQPIHARAWPAADAVAMVSRSHYDPATDAFLARLGSVKPHHCGSALKFAQVAEGTADVYPRLAPTCEWDVAAGHALIAAAGGIVTAPDGAALPFGCAEHNFRVPGFLAWGDPAKAAALHS